MSEEQDKAAGDSGENEEHGPRGGERLAEARRAQQISVLEVAKELHLDEHKVRALERNDFDVLGAPVFAKGHLRKYAQLVGVDEDDVFADYYKLTRQDVAPPIIVGRRRVSQELSPGPWIAVIIVILVAVAAYWWFAVYSSNPTTSTAPESSPQEPAVQQPDASIAGESRQAIPEAVAEQPDPESVAAEAEPVEAPAATPGEVALSLLFLGDCWTEITDASGRRLFFDMGRTGEAVDLTGVPPFSVLLGNVDNVSISVDGRDYPVASNNPGSRTARLSIVAP